MGPNHGPSPAQNHGQSRRRRRLKTAAGRRPSRAPGLDLDRGPGPSPVPKIVPGKLTRIERYFFDLLGYFTTR